MHHQFFLKAETGGPNSEFKTKCKNELSTNEYNSKCDFFYRIFSPPAHTPPTSTTPPAPSAAAVTTAAPRESHKCLHPYLKWTHATHTAGKQTSSVY